MKRGAQYILCIIVLLSICTQSILASDFYQDEEAELIYTSKELTLQQVTTASANITYTGRNKLNWIEASMNFYPINTYRQTVTYEAHNPTIFEKTPSKVIYRVEKPTGLVEITATQEIKTKNQYKPVTEKIIFPITPLSSDFDIYLQSTELIDTNEDIIATASIIASGKDDLFQVSQDVAIWVTNNIKYDLTTITADANQKASWVLTNRQGVCDELSVLYISMMRSIGVPARFASGISYTNSNLFSEPWNPHAWVEVYFPDHGWVPFDLTYKQFGYVDASHVKFKDSYDAESLTTSFQWEGTQLKTVTVDIKDTTFDMKVLEAHGMITDPMLITTELLYTESGFGSYNVLEIVAENTENHYVSSSLYINAPKEINLETKTLPIYLTPKEVRTYYILLKVSEDLNSKYVYTMPVGAYTSFGLQEIINLEVANDHFTATLQQVNSFLEQDAPKTSANDDATITCELSTARAYIDEEIFVTCIIQNKGNTYLTDGDICMRSEDLTITTPCEKETIPINHDITFTRTLVGKATGNKEFTITTDFEGFKTSKSYSAIIADKPNITISKITTSKEVQFDTKNNITVRLESASISKPQNIQLQVKIGSQRLEWNINDVDRATDFVIPFDSRVLQEGENVIEAAITWNDNRSAFEAHKSEGIILAPLNIWEKVLVFFYNLGM
jgi:transglutaminase-like putative cysteine protease